MVSLCLQAKRPRVGAAPRVVANQMGAFEVLPQELILSVLTASPSRPTCGSSAPRTRPRRSRRWRTPTWSATPGASPASSAASPPCRPACGGGRTRPTGSCATGSRRTRCRSRRGACCSCAPCPPAAARRRGASSTAAAPSAASRATAPAPASRCTGGWATRGSASPRTSGSWKPLPTTPSSMPTTAPMLLLCPLSTIIAPLTTTISVVLLLMLLLLSRHASTSRPASYSPALATTPLLSYVLS
ncbi:F-box protein [Zea mays]|uniref:F-box protein n=1 Tax=Zea mays TaxID=4577 RepID=A0A1D6H8A7_MAIZE|nr:F-box protein [Zea mays]